MWGHRLLVETMAKSMAQTRHADISTLYLRHYSSRFLFNDRVLVRLRAYCKTVLLLFLLRVSSELTSLLCVNPFIQQVPSET
jgi:hypothetical protein